MIPDVVVVVNMYLAGDNGAVVKVEVVGVAHTVLSGPISTRDGMFAAGSGGETVRARSGVTGSTGMVSVGVMQVGRGSCGTGSVGAVLMSVVGPGPVGADCGLLCVTRLRLRVSSTSLAQSNHAGIASDAVWDGGCLPSISSTLLSTFSPLPLSTLSRSSLLLRCNASSVMGSKASSTVVTFRTSTVWLCGSGGAGVSKMAGAAVTVCAGTVVVAAFAFVMLGSATVNVAASDGAVMANSLLSSESGKALSHFMWKCSTRVNHEEVTDGARFLYQSSAIEPDRQCK